MDTMVRMQLRNLVLALSLPLTAMAAVTPVPDSVVPERIDGAQPRNVVIYATSNRSHLIRENFSDRTGILDGEVHPKETLQETFSLSDRFGIRVTFVSASQAQYLAIVAALATQRSLPIDAAALRARAITWAQQQNGFSGRTARQFVDYLEGELGTSESL